MQSVSQIKPNKFIFKGLTEYISGYEMHTTGTIYTSKMYICLFVSRVERTFMKSCRVKFACEYHVNITIKIWI